MKTRIMLFCCMAAALLLLACSNDKSDGEGREPGVEPALDGTQRSARARPSTDW